MPPKRSSKARKRPQTEASRSPSPSRPAKHPKLSASPPPSPEDKKTRKSNKPDEGYPGWWPPEYAPAGKLLPANKAGMRKVIKAFQDANRDPTELWSEGGPMVQLVRQDPVGRIHQRIFDKIDFENLVPKTPFQTQRQETPSSEDWPATLDRENTEPTPEPLAESITIAASSVPEATESINRQPQTTDMAKPVSATIDTLRNGNALDSQDIARCANLFPRPSDWYIFPPGFSFTDADKIHAQHPALKARHIAFFVYSQDEDQWALCHLDVGKATLVHHLTNHLTKMPAEELVDWLRSQRKLNMKGMMFVKQPGPIHIDNPSGGIYSLVFLKCLMAKERVPRFVDIATARMEFIKMIGPADADENMATKDLTFARDARLGGDTILTGTPKDQAIPADPQLQAPSSKPNPAESSTHETQKLTMASPRLTAKKPEQIALISSSEDSPESLPDEPEFGEPTGDEASNTKAADKALASETGTPPSDPDNPLTLVQSLEMNFTAFLNQRRELEACVKAEKSSAKKNDQTIAELKQARQELIKKHGRGTYELRRKVSELETHLEAAKRALETAERAEKESDVSLTELGDKIRGEERCKAEAAERIKQWEATLTKTALQSM
ncbi:uncharacterized protein FFB20_15131 [Fusarium fujikuroi]|uniref:Uncharacterized protein n=1 Tax=Fusarium fujikuroi TaxID=5127 RepID=A0A2H3SPY2_FUSFU|nr:uncharacterized protein Y057_11008 [Fusarium fujikuroi]QGI88096.1 hypothetical protein CEK25_003052 [Fusarium fujikuroi]SCO15940.1 uncharacterized protein FFC1_12674 [Fusarium fujikuroi]SCO17047.1 uncharacterized protein FFB20_15131 [Fusarium fujikuroi]SCO21120.1 uncharacterized protein FFE2_14863 [Fusarium fujikuroi]